MNICFNGQFISADQPIFTPENPSFKWGDGIFETIKVSNGKIILQPYHFDRVFLSLKLLRMDHDEDFNQDNLAAAILTLCELNSCLQLARVRLAIFRNEKNFAEWVIEAFTIPASFNQWNEKGWEIDLYPFARKQTDAFANLKSSSYLPYVMAGKFAREKQIDEAIVLNTSNKICDGSKTNIFLLSKKQLQTPALHQGCINGVMRRHIITELKIQGWQIKQEEIGLEDLLEADEIFLTNAIIGLRWVRAFRDQTYPSSQSLQIYNNVVSTIWK